MADGALSAAREAARAVLADPFDGSLGQRALPGAVLRAVGAHDESRAAEGTAAHRHRRRLRVRRTTAVDRHAPGYVAVNVTQSQAGLLSCGFLPATYTPFHIDTTSGIGAISLDDEARKTLLRRWELLKKVDERLRNDSSLAAKAYRDYHNHYEGAVSMMSDQRASQVFQIDAADHDRYGKTQVGDGCILARNLVEADAGTHFVLVNHRDWDHHTRIYTDGKSLQAVQRDRHRALLAVR